jgi:hypothetical protein
MNLNNFLISYSNEYDITSFYNKNIYIDNINIISEKYNKIIILKKIGINNFFFYYIFNTKTTVAILCKNDIIDTIYLHNIILITTTDEIIKINIKYKSYMYTNIKTNTNFIINPANIENFINFDNNESEIIPEIYEIYEIDDLFNHHDINIENIKDIKLKKYLNNQIIQCCLDYENNVILEFKLFESHMYVLKNNNKNKIMFNDLIYDIYILNEKYFIIQFEKSYCLLDSEFKLLNELYSYNEIILVIEDIIDK